MGHNKIGGRVGREERVMSVTHDQAKQLKVPIKQWAWMTFYTMEFLPHKTLKKTTAEHNCMSRKLPYE